MKNWRWKLNGNLSFSPSTFPLVFCFLGIGASRTFFLHCLCVCGKHFHRFSFRLVLVTFWQSFLDRCTFVKAFHDFPANFPEDFSQKSWVLLWRAQNSKNFARNSNGSRRKWVVFTPFGRAPSRGPNSRKEPFRFQSDFFFYLSHCRKKHGQLRKEVRERSKNKHKQKSHKRGTSNETNHEPHETKEE